MESAYFETSVWFDLFGGKPSAHGIRDLLAELKRDKVRIVTSIITVQEVSVQSFLAGRPATDNDVRLSKLARIEGISIGMALTAAKLEAHWMDAVRTASKIDPGMENKRRKFDCFHIAAAMCLVCRTIYTTDKAFLKRERQLSLRDIRIRLPKPADLPLLQTQADPDETEPEQDSPTKE